MTPTPDQLVDRLGAQQHGAITVAQARASGLSHDDIRTRVRRGQYARLWRGILWIWAELAEAPDWETRAAGALLLHGPAAALGLGSAARALTVAGADQPEDTIQVVRPRGGERHQRPGITLHFWDIPESRTSTVNGLRCTDALQTAADLVPRLRRNNAVAFLDSALHQGLLVPDDLAAAQLLAAGRPGCDVARRWWVLADGRAASPLETWVRLDCIDGGVAPDVLQYPVHDSLGRIIGYGDLAWLKDRRRPLVGEADGAGVHSAPKAVYHDRQRANAFVARGVEIIRYTWADARRRGRCAAMTRNALANEARRH